MQDILENELLKVLTETKAEWGTAILMEVATGDIKAISNFDRAEKDSIYFEGVNHAVLGYEPGSVVKPISMMIALEDKVVSPNEKLRQAAHSLTEEENPFPTLMPIRR